MPKSEDRKLTPKENYLRMLNHEIPEYVPIFTTGIPSALGNPIPLHPIGPDLVSYHQAPDGDPIDIWGVEWVGNYDTGGARMPKTSDFLLTDICEWRDVIKAPDISGIDWEAMCKSDLEKFRVDRSKTAVGQTVCVGAFQELVSFMGFTEGLAAMLEEPEEVEALLDYITTFYCDVAKRYFEYLRPDVWYLVDDTCSQNAPFMSEELFCRLFVPCYKRFAEIANDNGIPIQFHNCGTAARFIEICHDELNVIAWDPAQTMNDLDGFKAKWGREIAIVGAFDPSGELLRPDCPQEALRETARDIIERLAPGGGFAFCGGFVGPFGDEDNARKQRWLEEAVEEFGGAIYD